MIKLELTAEQAVAVRYALLLHTKDDSVSFPIRTCETYPRSNHYSS